MAWIWDAGKYATLEDLRGQSLRKSKGGFPITLGLDSTAEIIKMTFTCMPWGLAPSGSHSSLCLKCYSSSSHIVWSLLAFPTQLSCKTSPLLQRVPATVVEAAYISLCPLHRSSLNFKFSRSHFPAYFLISVSIMALSLLVHHPS